MLNFSIQSKDANRSRPLAGMVEWRIDSLAIAIFSRITFGSEMFSTTLRPTFASLFPFTTACDTSSQIPM